MMPALLKGLGISIMKVVKVIQSLQKATKDQLLTTSIQKICLARQPKRRSQNWTGSCLDPNDPACHLNMDRLNPRRQPKSD